MSECPACPAVQDAANTAKETHDIGLGNNVLDRTPKSPSEKGKIISLELYFFGVIGSNIVDFFQVPLARC